MSADHLAVLLDDKDLDVVTVRAEMSRLRKVIGAEYLESRPYRLLVPITTDIGEVFDALDLGDVESALAAYHGPLLPQSVSPSIARLRMQLSASMRGAVLAECSRGDMSPLRRWLDLPEGARRSGRLGGAAQQCLDRSRGTRAGRRTPRRARLRTGLNRPYPAPRATVVQPCHSYL